MDDKDWTCLTTIFEEKSLSRAAEKLYIAQPSLTYRIKELEKKLGIKIFIKAKGSVKFTEEGLRLLEYANKMQVELKKLEDDLYEMQQPGDGVLKISAGEYFAHAELPDILSAFHQLYPNVKFNISSKNPYNILDNLKNADSHIAIIRSNFDWDGPKILLKKDPMCVISKQSLQLKDLPQLPRINFILTTPSKKTVDEWWQETFYTPPLIGMNVHKIETCIEIVRQNFGYAILPLTQAQIMQLQDDLHILPLHQRDDTPLELNIIAYYRQEITTIKTVKTFINFLKHYFSPP